MAGQGLPYPDPNMTSTIRCDIVSAEQEIFHGTVTMVVATGQLGELGIAPRHAPLITRLKPGYVRVTLENGQHQEFYVSGGILEVQPQVVSILADTAVRTSDLDEAKVRAAMEEVQRILARKDPQMDLAQAQAEQAMHLAQLQAIERLRKNLKH